MGKVITENRDSLLRALMNRNISQGTHLICSGKLKGKTDRIKEEKSAQMLTALQESKTEQEFILRLEKL